MPVGAVVLSFTGGRFVPVPGYPYYPPLPTQVKPANCELEGLSSLFERAWEVDVDVIVENL